MSIQSFLVPPSWEKGVLEGVPNEILFKILNMISHYYRIAGKDPLETIQKICNEYFSNRVILHHDGLISTFDKLVKKVKANPWMICYILYGTTLAEVHDWTCPKEELPIKPERFVQGYTTLNGVEIQLTTKTISENFFSHIEEDDLKRLLDDIIQSKSEDTS